MDRIPCAAESLLLLSATQYSSPEHEGDSCFKTHGPGVRLPVTPADSGLSGWYGSATQVNECFSGDPDVQDHCLGRRRRIAVVLIYAATRPDTFRVERAIGIKAPPEKIFPLIADFPQLGRVVALEKLDPAMKRTPQRCRQRQRGGVRLGRQQQRCRRGTHGGHGGDRSHPTRDPFGFRAAV